MAREIREKNWASLELGRIEDWPEALRTVLNLCLASPSPCLVVWGCQRSLFFNDAFQAAWGVEPESVGENAEKWMRPSRPELWRAIQQAEVGESVWLPAGSVAPESKGPGASFVGSASPVHDAGGAVRGVFLLLTESVSGDLAAELQSVNRLYNLNAQLWQTGDLGTALEAVLDASLELLGADLGNVQLFDPREEVLEIAVFRGFQRPFLERFSRVSASGTSACGRALLSGQRVIIEDVEQEPTYEHREMAAAAGYRAVQSTPLLSRRGEPLGMLSTHFVHPHRPSEGKLHMLDAFVRKASDFIERIHAERALRESEEHFRRITDAMPQLAWRADAKGRVDFYNSRAEEYAGIYRQSDGRWIWQPVVHPDDLAETTAAWHHSVSARELYEIEHRVSMKDGTFRWHLSRGLPFEDGDGNVTWYGTATDIDEQKRVTKAFEAAKIAAEAASASKSEFLANMSHEIRTPMTSILGYADLLAGRSKNPEDASAIEIIKKNGQFLLEIINDILDLSRIEAGKMLAERQSFAPDALVLEVRSLMEIPAREKHLPLQMDFVGLLPERVESDSKRLRQILINLVGNAIKFTDRGEVRVVTQYLQEQDRLRFDVIDTGMGMTKEERAGLFEPFYQADSSNTREYGGSGLGLAISRRLARMLGGEIRVESEAGRGSTFTLLVDAHVPAETKLVEPRAEIVESEGSNEPLPSIDFRVLVVDDQREVRRLEQYFVENAGGEAHTASNGAEAIQLWEEARRSGRGFDAILMDVQMPVMDGYETTRELRSRGFLGPIIAVTAHAMTGDREKALRAGCDAYLAKPVDSRLLLETLAKFVQAAPDRDTEGKRTGQCVLIVEDNPGLAKLLKLVVSSRGHEVVTAISGRAALEAAEDFQANVVLMDLGLPDYDGRDLIRLMTSSERSDDVVWIALSGRDSPEDRESALQSGFHHFMLKPPDFDELLRLIARKPSSGAPTD